MANVKQSNKVYFSLGSNIDAGQHIARAVNSFLQDFDDVLVSNLYRCSAVGFKGDDFLNLAVAFQTEQNVVELLDYAEHLEQQAGRIRVTRGRFDSRTLDVDLLMYGDFVGQQAGYQWPSEDIDTVAHVLCPVADIAKDDVHPISNRRFTSLWQEFDMGEADMLQIPSIWDQCS